MTVSPETASADEERRGRINEVWSADAEARAREHGWYWMAHPMVLARVNTLISGDADCDAYGRLERLYRERRWPLPIVRALSLGCGFGALERDLRRRGWIEAIDAYDLAEGAIQEARRLACEAGISGIRYHVADLDTMEIERASVDAVFAHSSVHHVQELERLYEVVHAALKPGGIFHLHEFVGPTRFQWTDMQLELVNGFLDSLPARLRRLPSGAPKGRMTRPTIEEMIAADPSEAIRSSEVISALEPCFDIVEERRTGGALLHLALGDIAQNFNPDSTQDRQVLEHLFALEDRMMAEGTIGSDFAVITCVARHDTARSPMPAKGRSARPPLATAVSLLFPPARRLYDTMRNVNAAVAGLKTDQADMAQGIEGMRAELQRVSREVAYLTGTLASAQARLPAVEPADRQPGIATDAPDDAELDRWVRREMQSAALRHLPFLPGEIGVDEKGIWLEGYSGAPNGLTECMAFFVNGLRIDDVEYPILDPGLKSRFSEIDGMGPRFRARMTRHLVNLEAARFWRFDAAPTGSFNLGKWRQAIHFMNPRFEEAPWPPEESIKRVIGDTSSTRFAIGGATIFKNLEHYLTEHGHSWSDFPDILDWGCGAGRVTRYLLSETGSNVVGADIDADNIRWCQQSYAKGHFEVVPLRPPTGFPDNSFNLVIGLSVLTHLQESDQWVWLSELQRITRPGALLFLSVQGPTQFAYNGIPPILYRRLQQDGFIGLPHDPALDAVILDREYYRSALHSRSYIKERWGAYFDVLAIEDAIAGLQDFVVLRRRA